MELIFFLCGYCTFKFTVIQFFFLFLNLLQPKLLVFVEKLSWVIGLLSLQLLSTQQCCISGHTDSHTHA